MLVISQEVPTHGNLSTTSVMRAMVSNLVVDEKIHYLGFRSAGSQRQIENPNFKYTLLTLPKRGERYFRFFFLPILLVSGLFRMITGRHSLIFATFPDDSSLFLGYLLSVLGGKRFYPYFMDLYQETGVWAKPLDKWLQKRAFKRAERVVVINEGMEMYYKENYGISPVCLPHVLPLKPLPIKLKRTEGDVFTIGYSGTINEARIEGLRQLKDAITDMPNVRMLIFSPQDQAYLKRLGIWSDNFEQRNIPDFNELLQALSNCDALYNPVVYSERIDLAQIRTSFGGKMVEYIASGVPIVIDSDKSFFTYQFMAKMESGVLVEHKSIESIRAAIVKLQDDADYYFERANTNQDLRHYFSVEKMNEIFNTSILNP